MKIKPHETALPLLIKPWHHATVRWDKNEELYVVTFEGVGYKKLLFTSATKVIADRLKALGFTQYKIKAAHSRNFNHIYLRKKSTHEDGSISWFIKYAERNLFVRRY